MSERTNAGVGHAVHEHRHVWCNVVAGRVFPRNRKNASAHSGLSTAVRDTDRLAEWISQRRRPTTDSTQSVASAGLLLQSPRF